MVILPEVTLYFTSKVFQEIAGPAEQGERVILLFTKEEEERENLRDDSFYPIGVSGYVTETEQKNVVAVHTDHRINVEHVSVAEDGTIEVTTSVRTEVDDMDPVDAKNRLQNAKQAIKEFDSKFIWGESYNRYVDTMQSMNEVITALSYWLRITSEERYAILAADSVSERTQLEEKALYEYLELAEVQGDAESKQQEDYRDMYREGAIRRQIAYLQKELDEMHPENVSDVQKFEQKINESGMNPEARDEAMKVLNRLKQGSSSETESGIYYDYLDFVTSLSWKPEPVKHVDLDKARKILDRDHYGLEKVKKRILQHIAVMNLREEQSGSILLFEGAPGTGKTSIGKSIAKALGRKYVRISLGGVRDEADIRGHRRTYIGAMAGRIMEGIRKSGVSNPVMVLDEIDKVSASYNGDPASALLEALDPEQNNTFTDHYMNVPYDLSNVLFICTANTLDTIPGPLLDRMEVIHFDGYTPVEKLKIAKKHLLKKSMEQMGIQKGQLKISDSVLKTIISDYTREAGVRGLRKRIDALCRDAAVRIEENETEDPVVITKDDLRKELDMRPMRHLKVPGKQDPGIVTGLAWTQVGGVILYIETLRMKGSGKINLTGQLGDVMKESAQIAVSLVKSMFPEKAEEFDQYDMHIHIPEGAVPKDGPSAGITMTTAIASLVTGKAVDPHVAMTGEVSLSGRVTAIGGLPEKLMAAMQAGVKRVFIPKENEEDLVDVAEEVTNALEIIPVEKVKDVLKALDIL
ncbi:ATP-dependent Lon protease [Eubacterium pyruvativorans]|uniref:endopeptidase La n=4 Tax=Eubacterium TaxID=1730 RepID=A0A1I7FAN4_9FIRM|nr:ATP-dependent Lon protease [Eubacterium pyruvativorans]SFU33165.1 ATP-dependent Lon protease [Eubacterium pyruvativorans]